ncbi:LysR family transcriptional regulator [Ramlibacter sp. Leaf400]|uniref:LysR family transcriptional regulator n=1 Tax=Ramlibacter sp. Leaf400 TaxID=1736365 RepID=UPI0006F6D53D|nr:LysR family transcriptional regulator [Ramlibacter sp. Leaf400]KQT11564.1 LysR family transcriptional regulator [Ramlibacter sp. Leaf400]
MTFKQLEAIYWVARLGGFAQAASKLHTTQSAISKRVQELESLFDTPLFDRTLRTARLTDKGEEMFAVAQRLLEQRDSAVEQFLRPEVIERRLRLGVTELTAMTWLPRLVHRIETFYPRVVIEPDVDTSAALRDKLLEDELDLAIVPDAFEDPRFASRPVGDVELQWMCRPGMVDSRKPLRLHELAKYRLLTQSNKSGTGIVVDRWLSAQGMKLPNTLSSSNMLALISMTVSGLGVTYLPWRCLQPMIDDGMLALVKVTPALPATPYVALYRTDQRSTLIASVTMLAQESCDFTRMFQTGTPQGVADGA